MYFNIYYIKVSYLVVLLDPYSVSECVGLKVEVMWSVDLYNISCIDRHMHGVNMCCGYLEKVGQNM
jgi:hypothetical protein